METIKELKKVSLSLKVVNGTDNEGNTVYKTKSFSNVKGDATTDAVFAVAEGIKAVMKNNVTAYYLNETSLVQEN